MAGDGRVRHGYKRFTVDLPEDYEKDLRRWAVEDNTSRGVLARSELMKSIDRYRRRKAK